MLTTDQLEDATYFDWNLVVGGKTIFIIGMSQRLMLLPHFSQTYFDDEPGVSYHSFSWLFLYLCFPQWKVKEARK